MKYIDADKLKAEIEKRQEYLGDHNCHSMASEYDWLLTMVQSLQQEQPEVGLNEEIDRFLKSEESITYENAGSYKVAVKDPKKIARHFYKLGQCTKYQQDRAEFAKLKTKEWQEGYDEGYLKGLNARKEEKK